MLVNAERIIGRFEQQPSEVKRYRVDYRPHLADGETISAPTITVTPVTVPPAVVANVAIAPDGDQLVAFFSGGLSDTTYRIRFLTPTSDNQILEDEIELRVVEF